MPKSVAVEDFAAKLNLVCKRLNWSRAKLAQQAAIDKSLAGRWLSGASRPTANSLMRLTDAVARDLPDFIAASWDLAAAALAGRIGVADAGAASGTGTRPPAGTPLSLRALGRFAEDIDAVAPIFCGFYRIWFQSFADARVILCRRARIFRRGDEMRFENDGTTLDLGGPCFVANRRLYLIVETPTGDTVAMGVLGGPYTTRVRRLTGFVVADLRANAAGGIAMAPGVAEFVKPITGDATADAATWEALGRERRDLASEREKRRAMPREIFKLLGTAKGVRASVLRPID
jgi:transcriptional regulator with XRE-family HTH domain